MARRSIDEQEVRERRFFEGAHHRGSSRGPCPTLNIQSTGEEVLASIRSPWRRNQLQSSLLSHGYQRPASYIPCRYHDNRLKQFGRGWAIGFLRAHPASDNPERSFLFPPSSLNPQLDMIPEQYAPLFLSRTVKP